MVAVDLERPPPADVHAGDAHLVAFAEAAGVGELSVVGGLAINIGTLVKLWPTPNTSSVTTMPIRPMRTRLGGSSVLIAACTYLSAAPRA